MKTDDLITLLVTEAGPARKVSAIKRLAPAAIGGGLVAAALVITVFGLIPGDMFFEPGPWIKIAYASALALAAASLVASLGKPGVSGKQPMYALLALMLAMVAIGGLSFINTPEAERVAAMMGHSWLTCPWIILGLSLPVMAGSFWAMKGFAPTQLKLAGAACGLFSGAVAAVAYALACTEAAAPFIAIWYTLGIAMCGALGAFLGPKLLNW